MKYKIAIIAIALTLASHGYGWIDGSDEIPKECKKEKIIKDLQKEGLPTDAEAVSKRQDQCLFALDFFAVDRETKRVLVNLNFVPEGCESERVQSYYEEPANRGFKEGKLALRRSICMFSRSVYRYLRGDVDLEIAENETILKALQDAQTRGLDASNQTMAGFLEGIVHCRQAEIFYEKFRIKPADNNLLERIRFCSARDKAFASFAAVDFTILDFEFTKEYKKIRDNPTLPSPNPPTWFDDGHVKLINKMSRCYGGNSPLSSFHNSTCGQLSNVPPHIRDQIINAAVSEVISHYFGATGAITAMLGGKTDRVKIPMEEVAKKVDKLKTQANRIVTNYNQVNDLFNSTIKGKLEIAMENYQNAFVTITAIDDWFRRWEAGLLRSPNGNNKGKELDERVEEIKFTKEQVEARKDLIEKFKNNLKILLNRPNEYEKSTRLLCRLYFCQMSPVVEGYQKARSEVCATIEYQNSALCNSTMKIKSPFDNRATATVMEICKKANFEDKFAKPVLTKELRKECLSQMNREIKKVSR